MKTTKTIKFKASYTTNSPLLPGAPCQRHDADFEVIVETDDEFTAEQCVRSAHIEALTGLGNESTDLYSKGIGVLAAAVLNGAKAVRESLDEAPKGGATATV